MLNGDLFDLLWLLTYGGVHKLFGQNRMLVIFFMAI